jgi:2-octaprenyl-6-methoxyphenol hydroxylase
MAVEAAPIRQIHVADAGRAGFARLDSREHDIDAFGYVITNRSMGRVLNAALAEHVSLERRMPARCTAVAFDDDGVVLHTEPGERPLRARLVVAADGANSLVRAAAGLEANVEDYQQVAIVAHVASSRPADGTAYERFTPSGPFAVLPLQDGHYGIVWTLSPAAAEEILALSDADYLARLQVAFGWRIGRLLRVGRRQAYPLRLTRAAAVTAERCVLIGNAAQALHPVAGQGFNLGLRDAVTLAELLADARRDQRGVDVGSAALLAEFARRRSADREGIIDFTDRLVKLFGDQRPGVPLLRDIGLLLFDLSPTAKQAMSRLSWGFAGRTPRLARGLSL